MGKERKQQELVRQKNGIWRWNPVYRKEYFLGWHHGRVVGIGRVGEQDIYARYFGIEDGKFIFFREKEGEVLKYSSPVNANTVFYTDGDDEPSIPAFDSCFDGKITDENEKKAILQFLGKKFGKLEEIAV